MKTLANCGQADFSTVFDVVHLDRQTFGDADLRAEVLKLFLAQLREKARYLPNAIHSERIAIAHTLRGSARGVGAVAVAEASQAVELDAGNIIALTELLDTIAAAVSVLETLESQG